MSIINNYLALDIVLTWQGRNLGPREQQQNYLCCESAQLCFSHHKLHLLWPGLDLSPVFPDTASCFPPFLPLFSALWSAWQEPSPPKVMCQARSSQHWFGTCSWCLNLLLLFFATFSCSCLNLFISLIHVKEGKKFQAKKIGVNDHVCFWPAVMATLDKQKLQK